MTPVPKGLIVQVVNDRPDQHHEVQGGGGAGEPWRRSPFRTIPALDALVLASIAALGLISLPFTFVPTYTPRLAVLVCLLPVGLGCLWGALRRGSAVAIVAAILAGWVVVSSLLSGTALLALLGAFGRESSGLILIASIAAWAAARAISSRGASYATPLLVAVLGTNAVVGLAQILFQISSGPLALYDGRATGLLVAHVYLGAAMAGAAGLMVSWVPSPRPATVLAVALFAAVANLSGSRFPIVLGLIAVVSIPATARRVREAFVYGLGYIAGVAISVLIAARVTEGATATERSFEAGGAGRLELWRFGLEAMIEQPILGWGPGAFRSAVQGKFTAEFTAVHNRSEFSSIWWDPHNIGIRLGVELGIVGLILAAAFYLLVIREARGPTLVFALVVTLTWALEPAGLVMLPLVMLCLGLASVERDAHRNVEDRDTVAPAAGRHSRLLVLAGLGVGLTVLLLDLQLASAARSGSPSVVERAAQFTPWDPVLAKAVGDAHAQFGSGDASYRKALEWMLVAHDRDPRRPGYLNNASELHLVLGEHAAARDQLEAALTLHPWNTRSLVLLHVAADRLGNSELREDVAARLCQVRMGACSESAIRRRWVPIGSVR